MLLHRTCKCFNDYITDEPYNYFNNDILVFFQEKFLSCLTSIEMKFYTQIFFSFHLAARGLELRTLRRKITLKQGCKTWEAAN
jgi:hypothetical protein